MAREMNSRGQWEIFCAIEALVCRLAAWSPSIDEADSRLNAAAPDLYVEMRDAMQYLEGTLGPCDDDCECLLHGFRAALRKAEGR